MTVRHKVERGELPLDVPEKMYAGFGRDNPCDGCDQPIGRAQVEYEFTVGDRTLRLHLGCAGLLEAARRRAGITPREHEDR